MVDWKYIMIHHSLSEDSNTYSWGAIKDYHVNNNNWSDIGYHFGIEKVRGHYSCLVGRPLTKYGAHCTGMNHKAIGVCFVGNYDKKSPEDDMLYEGCKRIIQPLMNIFEIPSYNIVFHRDFSSKSCPGNKFTKQQIFDILERV